MGENAKVTRVVVERQVVKKVEDQELVVFQGGFQLLDLIIMELKSHMTC